MTAPVVLVESPAPDGMAAFIEKRKAKFVGK